MKADDLSNKAQAVVCLAKDLTNTERKQVAMVLISMTLRTSGREQAAKSIMEIKTKL